MDKGHRRGCWNEEKEEEENVEVAEKQAEKQEEKVARGWLGWICAEMV